MVLWFCGRRMSRCMCVFGGVDEIARLYPVLSPPRPVGVFLAGEDDRCPLAGILQFL